MMIDQTSNSGIHNWLQFLEREGKSQHTIDAYRRALTHFVRWSESIYGGKFDSGAIIPRDVRDWKSYQQTLEKTAPATINQRLVALARFYDWGVQEGLARTNPTSGVGSIRLPQRQPKSLPKSDLRRLLRAVHTDDNLRDVAVVEVLAGTGIRVGELLALDIGDVVIKERSGQLTVRQGKHGGFREVPLTHDVRHALSVYLDSHPDKDDPDAALWVSPQGRLSHRSSIVRVLKKYAYQAEIEAVTPHTLRHTFATRYLEANPDDLRGLAALLGHARLDTVMIYTEPRIEDLAARLERIELNN
jgi:site-specific recombinase XerC